MKHILLALMCLIALSSEALAVACTNPIGVKDGTGAAMNFNTTVDGSSNCTSNIMPGAVLTTLSGWTSGTALNATQTLMSANSGAPAILIQLNQTTTISAGAATFEGTYDGTNWVTVSAAQVLNPNTLAPIAIPYTLVASTNQPFMILTQGYQGVRIKLSTQITGSATVTPFVALLSTNPAIGALLNPLAAGSAIIGKVGVDQTTPGTTNGVAIVGVNAATALAGNGVTGTGSSRVTIASDNTPFPTKIDQTTPGTTNNVAVSYGSTALIADPCQANTKNYLPISQTTSTQLFAGTSAKKTYVCHIFVLANAAETVTLVSGTGSICATSPHGMIGPASVTALGALSANGGFSLGNGGYAIAASTTNADNVCLVQVGAVQLTGVISYVAQ